MPVSRTISSILLLGLLAGPGFAATGLATPSLAAERRHGACLDRAEQRAAVASHRAIPLALAIRSLHMRGHRAEVVRAELCERGGRLVYVLTLLPRSGKVTRAVIDAGSGNPVGGG
jgi:hypothetical protein